MMVTYKTDFLNPPPFIFDIFDIVINANIDSIPSKLEIIKSLSISV